MPTHSDMNRRILCSIMLSVVATCAFAQAPTARLLAQKQPNPNFRPNTGTPFYRPLSSTAPALAKYAVIADYLSRVLYEGPAANFQQLSTDLRNEGLSVTTPDDLEHIYLNGFRYDSFTQTTNSPPAPPWYSPQKTDGLFVLGLAGYPTPEWLKALQFAGVRLIEAVPPSGYLVRVSRATASRLSTDFPFVRAVFPVTPGGKKSLLADRSQQPFQRVFIQAVEEQPQDSIEAQLRALSAEPILVVARKAPHVIYTASLSDSDIDNLTFYETVYAISGFGEPRLSSERQALLATQPAAQGTALTLPSPRAWPDYTQYLINNGFSNFNATVVALLDTGLDNGIYDGSAAEHPDFTASMIDCIPLTQGGDCADHTLHGTMTASIVAGYPANSNVDADGYFWDEGFAPTVHLIVDKFNNCNIFNTVDQAFEANNPNLPLGLIYHTPQPQVVNFSINFGDYSYDANSVLFDQFTRRQDAGWLFTVSAGNVLSGYMNAPDAPATAKNVVAVGATHIFTGPVDYQFDNNPNHVEECAWCHLPPNQDARNIPTMSPASLATPANLGNSMLKPDLVAPGTRITGPLSRTAISSWCKDNMNNPDAGNIFCNIDLAHYSDSQSPPQPYQYGFSGGTSFSAPAVAGAAAVIRQWYTQTLRSGSSPSAALTKAILINGARSLQDGIVQKPDFTPLLDGNGNPTHVQHISFDPYQGWGALNIARLLGSAANYFVHDQGDTPPLGNGDTWQQAVTVVDGSQEVRITLVWTEQPGNANSPYVAKNDLDLVATYGSCLPCYIGNKFSSSSGYSVGYVFPPAADSKNNVKEIVIQPGSFASGTTLSLLVQGTNVTTNGLDAFGATNPMQQDFALFVTNAH